MEANLRLANVRVRDVKDFDVQIGQSFTIEIVNPEGEIRWFTDNDEVLDITSNGLTATIAAKVAGSCEVQINIKNNIKLRIFIFVYEQEATEMKLNLGTPTLK